MDWHLLKRNYDLFLGNEQFGRVDGQFLAWEFAVRDGEKRMLATIDRNWYTAEDRELLQ